MKLMSYRFEGKERYGVVVGSGIVEISSKIGERCPTLRDVFVADCLDQVADLSKKEQVDHPISEVEVMLPIPNAQKVMCAGRNYRAYHEVMEEGKTPPFPSIFGRFLSSFSAHNEDILKPQEGEQLDYEGELGVIIGKRGHRVSQEYALEYVAGYTCLNEGTVRDWMKKGTQNTPAKNFYRSGSIGPWMVSADEIVDPSALHIITRRNGKVVQEGGTDLMIFNPSYLISHISKFTWLEPGDIIATGSPGGSIIESENPQWLQAGDVLEVEVSQIGLLRNSILDE